MILTCPYCGSSKLFKAGFRVTKTGQRIQRYLCRNCLRRFSLLGNPEVELNISRELVEGTKVIEQPPDAPSVVGPALEPSPEDSTLPLAKDLGVHSTRISRQGFYSLRLESKDSREESESELPAGAAKMSNPEGVVKSILVQQPGAGQDKELEGKLINFAWWLKKQGKSDKTIRNYVWMLRLLAKHGADLEDPESIKDVLARLDKGNRWKRLAINAYSAYLKMHGLSWNPPKVNIVRKLPFIPLESELDALIAGCGPKTSTLLQLLKETGMRIGEALRLTWRSVDLERRVIILNEPEKNSNPRVFKISDKLIGMLNRPPKTNERVFPLTYNGVKNTFEHSRHKLAMKLNNPRLMKITFHTFRHWKATMEYHKTKDIMHVKELLGHKNIENTMLYIQVEKALFNEDSSEFTVKVAKTPEEIQSLLEAGFEYVCEKDDLMFFKKRK